MLNVFLRISAFFKHVFKIFKHKYFVCKYCFKTGLYWRGIVHDLSKFHPKEFFESVKYYNGKRSPIDVCKEKNGYSLAWLHHKGANDHHFEYWDNISIPYKPFAEMICDWFGACKAYNGNKYTPLQESQWWWYIKRPTMPRINKHTLKRIDAVMRKLEEYDSFNETCKNLKNIYYSN